MPVVEGAVPHPRPGLSGRIASVVFALAIAGSTGAAESTGFPRADLAAGAQRLAHVLDQSLGSGAVLAAIEALGGPVALQYWLFVLADTAAALDAPALMD